MTTPPSPSLEQEVAQLTDAILQRLRAAFKVSGEAILVDSFSRFFMPNGRIVGVDLQELLVVFATRQMTTPPTPSLEQAVNDLIGQFGAACPHEPQVVDCRSCFIKALTAFATCQREEARAEEAAAWGSQVCSAHRMPKSDCAICEMTPEKMGVKLHLARQEARSATARRICKLEAQALKKQELLEDVVREATARRCLQIVQGLMASTRIPRLYNAADGELIIGAIRDEFGLTETPK